jgi:hypothetical protein
MAVMTALDSVGGYDDSISGTTTAFVGAVGAQTDAFVVDTNVLTVAPNPCKALNMFVASEPTSVPTPVYAEL